MLQPVEVLDQRNKDGRCLEDPISARRGKNKKQPE